MKLLFSIIYRVKTKKRHIERGSLFLELNKKRLGCHLTPSRTLFALLLLLLTKHE